MFSRDDAIEELKRRGQWDPSSEQSAAAQPEMNQSALQQRVQQQLEDQQLAAQQVAEQQRQQYQDMNAISAPQAVLQGVGDTLSFGTIPKVGGRIGAIGARALRPDLFEDETLDQTYAKARDYLRNANNQAASDQPLAYGSGQIGGAVLNPIGRNVNSVKGAIKAGGLYSALYGLGSSDKGDVNELNASNLIDAGVSGVEGAAFGGVAQKALQGGAPYVNSLVEKLASSLGKRAGTEAAIPSVVTPQGAQAQRALELSQQFNVPISKGQATQDTSQQVLEDMLASGAKGADPAAIVNAQRTAQQQAFQDAAGNLRKTIGGGDFVEKGQSLEGATQKILADAGADKKAISDAYNLAKDKVGYLDINNVRQFNNIGKAKLAEEALSPENAPAAYNQLNAFDRIFSSAPENARGVDFRRIEAYRQGLTRAGSAAQGQDKYGINVLKGQFDDFLDNTIESALVKGDSKVLDQFKNARALNSKYMKNYTTKDPTAFGTKFVQDVVEHGNNYTPSMISDKIFGASKYGFKPQAVSIVNELKTRLGADSPEFQGVKLDAVQKVIKPLLNSRGEINFNNPAVQSFKNNLYEQKSVLKNMLAPEEFKQLSDFGDLGSLLFQSKKSVINPPQSGLFNAISELPFIKQALGVADKVVGLPGIKQIPEAVSTAQAKSSFNPASIQKSVAALNVPPPTFPNTMIPGQAALAGTSMMNTSPPTSMPMAATQPSFNQPTPTTQAQPQVPEVPEFSQEEILQELQRREKELNPVTPQLLNKISQIESGNNPLARAEGGSASGLFQFTNGTWKDVVKKYGDETGITLADKNNPKAQRIMAEKMLKDNSDDLKVALGRNPTDSEIYLTHFLGLGGAKKILSSNPDQYAARVLPEAAKANRGMFFRNGQPLTVAQFYQNLNKKVMAA